MSALRELYQQVIIDHSKQPRHYGVLPEANCYKEGFNPLCGDKLSLHLLEQDGLIKNATFEGNGCAISIASASLMLEAIRGKTCDQIEAMFHDFHRLVTQGHDNEIENKLGKLAVLAGVAEFPARVKCATLAWHTLRAALLQDTNLVTTE